MPIRPKISKSGYAAAHKSTCGDNFGFSIRHAGAVRAQLPEEKPWLVEPNPPREVDELELDEVELPLVLRPVDDNAVETDVGARRDWL